MAGWVLMARRRPTVGTGMIEYRAYAIGCDGHVIRYEPLICANDEVAIAQARARLPDQAIELWSGTRFVARLAAGR